ncbi:hypothetical protein [Sulfurimonas sp.]|uniref:hypothetical protein n=1 Tax=Sulfurimonas sp. TaxID=2022749 RepID=UPI00260063CA|nr:hypothetical protein [Sulfurimonas sp.]
MSSESIDYPERLISKIIQKQREGYLLEDMADVDNIVLWYDKKKGKYFKEVLCRVYMHKQKSLYNK